MTDPDGGLFTYQYGLTKVSGTFYWPEAEMQALRGSITRGKPFGDADWMLRTAEKLDLQSTLRPRGRPKNSLKGSPHLFYPPKNSLKGS